MIHGQGSSGPLGRPGLASRQSAVDSISKYHDLAGYQPYWKQYSRLTYKENEPQRY